MVFLETETVAHHTPGLWASAIYGHHLDMPKLDEKWKQRKKRCVCVCVCVCVSEYVCDIKKYVAACCDKYRGT